MQKTKRPYRTEAEIPWSPRQNAEAAGLFRRDRVIGQIPLIANRLLKTFDPQFAALTSLSAATEKAFGLRFFSDGSDSTAGRPLVMVAAPGRVNLIGEHIDYNDGFVLPMAIDRYTVIAGRAIPGDRCQIVAADLKQEHSFSLAETVVPPQQDAQWFDYLRGVVAGFRSLGDVPAFQMVVSSSVPLGSGLSSSAALEVATATFLESLTGMQLPPAQKALLCQTAEHRYAKVPCGIMDQFSSVFGQPDSLMLLDCRDQTIKQVPFNGTDVAVLIANTNVKHALTGGEYGQRRQQCEEALKILGAVSYRDCDLGMLQRKSDQMSDVHFRRARHVITEIQRTCLAAEAIQAGQWLQAGQWMYESHQSLKDDFEVSCDELNVMVRAAREASDELGFIGSRMTGGGFGGCTVSLVLSDRASVAADYLSDYYRKATGIEPTIFVSRPSLGAHRIQK